jgi:hypothetical protein
MLGLLAGLLMACAQWADAQFTKPPIKLRIGTPDLVVAVNAPAKINHGGQGSVEITVHNALTSMPHPTLGSILVGATVHDAPLLVLFAGLTPLAVQANNNYQCQIATHPFFVWCGGPIGAGDTATIEVLVEETGSCPRYCAPVYTDAFVDPSNLIVERSDANNRAVGATDVICID